MSRAANLVPKIVFSDVDDTIIRGKTLIEFVEHLKQRVHGGDARLDSVLADLARGVQRGIAREDLNRHFYGRIMRGRTVAEVAAASASWFRDRSRSKDFYKESICSLLADMRSAGAQVVLVSGSFAQILAPIAEKVHASALLVTELERIGDTYTGAVLGQVLIGEGKAAAIRRYARAHETRLEDCVGIGDHPSDIPFIGLTGHGFVPADADPQLLLHATAARWSVVQTNRIEG